MLSKNRPWLSKYDQGVPHEIDIPNISLVALFKSAVRDSSDSTCIVYQGESFTYQAVDELSDRVARYLIKRGLIKGDRVGILLTNTPEFVISYYGILKAGGVVMAINPAFRPAEVEAQALESGIQILILPDRVYPTLKALKARTPLESMVVVGDLAVNLLTGDLSWEAMLEEHQQGEPVTVPVSPDDPAVFQYSGGTTGTPKCAIGLHRNLVANVYQFDHWLVNTQPGEETLLVAIPIYHVYGMVLGMNLAVKMGARMVLIPDPRNLDALLQAAEDYQATVFPGVPSLYAAINHYPAVLSGGYDLSSIKACISGSATLPIKVKHDFESLTNGHLVEGYGLSEAPTATHCNPILGENREGSIGLPLPNVDCKVVDLETGQKELDIGEIGELIVKGPQVMAGYYQRPEETTLTLRDGWLFTGDVVRMDQDGYFYLVDRKKDVIKVGGFQVWPNEIEAVIMGHPKVKEVAVAGVPDENGTEVAKAWVVLKEGETSSPEEIQAYCDEFLTRYKIPKYIVFRTSLPRTMVGKVLRRVLSAEAPPSDQ
jgi:long-chain acyl-CoA synthetase